MADTAHPPKVEVFDIPVMTNTDPKGFVRAVDEYRVTDYGLYMSRATPGHDKFFWLESWLLPALDLRANIFHFHNPDYRPGQRLYLDIGEFWGPDVDDRWHARDWYLDLVDVDDKPLELIDVDELFDAHTAGYLTTAQCEKAVATATTVLVGAAEHRHDVQAWLDGQVGEPLTWRVSPPPRP